MPVPSGPDRPIVAAVGEGEEPCGSGDVRLREQKRFRPPAF
jgi:hypothetical protein